MDLANLLTYLIVSLFVYVVGICFHSKIIKVSLKDKDVSWQLDVIYSSVRVFVNTFAYFLYGVTYIVPNLHHFTGKWFCYASKMILQYNYTITAYYTLMVAILKYVIGNGLAGLDMTGSKKYVHSLLVFAFLRSIY